MVGLFVCIVSNVIQIWQALKQIQNSKPSNQMASPLSEALLSVPFNRFHSQIPDSSINAIAIHPEVKFNQFLYYVLFCCLF